MEKVVFTFTPCEWEIIEHRLECSDGLYEAVIQYNNNAILRSLDRDDVYDITRRLLEQGRDIVLETRAEYEIFKDAIEGGVFMAIADQCKGWPGEAAPSDGISHGKYIAYVRAANRIEEKTGWNVPRT